MDYQTCLFQSFQLIMLGKANWLPAPAKYIFTTPASMGVGLSGKRGDRSLKKEEDIFTWRAREDISRIAKVQKSAEKIIQLTFK